ncbi:hypothetical protein AX777_21315 [Sphingobium yanoikuyae]|jgi:hypothetical protein|uniref:Uncharacterized protein n=1 Tax=Sphingobium yanoikuyae TaxID=13690 RepID=A0A177JM36_SPHYA|nr:hypothetical protein [Sphingobium yanoikuyae]OAH41854.1 hypothetical protein AX777_21315 [Sphingobium yanoikuyae]
MTDRDTLLALADQITERMIANAKNAMNSSPGVTGQRQCMQYASYCAIVAAALRARAGGL